ncbi:CBS domain-containing protein [candidate division KSB3 bacterium]|uniref:CBS domain-containing protein n=1 Tax=candidate division KSB3 bacterium TaxID=2044937 RepID=A0A9D5JT22_9BACT|nr:CBS domain-containing protein [candidate division KSB3 bacterium]MBD3323660.1 CBS domain-containing protein [candidate division KSB3 bacterium]
MFLSNLMDYHTYLTLGLFLTCLVLLLLVWRVSKSHSPANAESPSDEDIPPHDAETSESLPTSFETRKQELLSNIREFWDGIVREVMVPRIDVVAVDESTSLKEFRMLALEKGHSRIPVYRETIDHIVGIAYVKDMLDYWDADQTATTVASFMRSPYFVPETKNIGDLLHEFQIKKVHIAVAIDEYGGTAGLVTIEDLLEVIFGEIVDEHDEEEETLITVIDENTFEVNAKASIDELEEYVGKLTIEQQDFETVGGLLFSILGEIPTQNETVEYQNLRFTILHADRHRVLQVKVERIPEAVQGEMPL